MVEEEKNETADSDTGAREERERFRDILSICEDIKDSLKSLFPAEFIEHMSNAGKENLLAVRSLIDATLKRLDRQIERTERNRTSRDS